MLVLMNSLAAPPIPVLGVPVINSVAFVERLIASIDYPVLKLVFVHNRDTGQPNEQMARLLSQARSRYVDKMVVHTFSRNIGVSGAWNAIMLWHPSSWWLIANSDIVFRPGILRGISERVNAVPNACIWHTGIGWSAFVISNTTFGSVGPFDENIWPAYSEDCDYMKRLAQKNCTVDQSGKKSDFRHLGSASWRSSSRRTPLYHQIRRQHKYFNNFDYMAAKWGNTECNANFKHASSGAWKMDMQRRRARGGPEACVACGSANALLMDKST